MKTDGSFGKQGLTYKVNPCVYSYDIGKFSLSYIIKSALGNNTHGCKVYFIAVQYALGAAKMCFLEGHKRCQNVGSTFLY